MASASAVQIEGISLNISVKDNASTQLNKIADSLERMQKAMDVKGVKSLGSASAKSASGLTRLAKSTSQFANSIMRIAKYRLIRTALKAITEGLTEGIQNLARYSAAMGEADSMAANSVMSDYASKFLELKNAVGSAAMPVLAALQPIIIGAANALIYLANAINMVVSAMRGSTTYTKATAQTVDYAKSLDKATGSAKKFKDATTGIDELNVINQDSSSGGGSSSTPDYANMFTEDIIPQALLDKLELIKDLAIAIGAALLAWKIGSLFTSDLGKLAGIAMAVAGAILYVKNLIDAWNNGFNLDNLIGAVSGAALVVGGLALAFGHIGAGVGALVVGIGLLVTSIKDIITNGLNLYNTLGLIAGIIGTGLGISLLTGTFIPLLIAGFIAAIVAVVYFTGHGEEAIEGFRLIIEGFSDFITNVFQGNFTEAFQAVANILYGIQVVGDSVIKSFETMLTDFLGWLDIKTNGNFASIIAAAQQYVSGMADAIEKILAGITTFLSGVFTLDISKALDGIALIAEGIADRIITAFEGAINVIIGGLNFLIEKANSILEDSVLEEGLESMGINFDGIPTIPTITLDRTGGSKSTIANGHGGGGDTRTFADGGFPTMGQLFIANEAGAEMVGSIDGHTAVANNQDIVSAVSSGVYAAVTNAMSSNSSNKAQSINIYLDGKQIEASVRGAKQRRGASIANGGIYNFA